MPKETALGSMREGATGLSDSHKRTVILSSLPLVLCLEPTLVAKTEFKFYTMVAGST